MASSHQNIALDWVRAEVDQTLLLARNALELFANDRSEPTQLNFCLSHLHQVVGTLKMVELYGAATVASQMEELCAALRDNSVASFDEALEALMAGILHLQNYLETANEALADVPSTLVPVFNDLKAAKGEEFVAAGFHPDLAGNAIEPNPVLNARMQDKKVAENLRKLRQRFQSSLANVIRNTNSQEHLNFLSKVIERLEKFSKGSPLGQLWTIAYAFLETLNASEESLGSAQKQLLRELDIQLKAMIDEADDAMTRLVPTSLLENLLYYVATSDVSSERITSLRDQFGLQIDEDPEKEILGPDKSTLSTIASVLMEELASFKDKIDLVSRDQSAQVDDLKELIPALRQMASSLQMVGISDAEKVLEEQVNVLDSPDFVSVDQDSMMNLADAILSVEVQVRHLAEGPEAANAVPVEQFENANAAVIEASKASIELAKNGIVGFITSNWDIKQIEGVPAILESVRGGLQIIPLEEAAELISGCSRYVSERLIKETVKPDWSELDRLADAISSIEYYIERLSEGASESDRFLEVARESLHKLGVTDGSDATTHISPHHISEAASEAPESVAKESDEQLIDQDILEIFAEEVEEVTADIEAATKVLHVDATNQEALADLRRAFHTLKGSGKLVGANAIADLAWVVEERLNKRIEQTIEIKVGELDVIDQIRQNMAPLLEAFSKGQDSDLSQSLAEKVKEVFDGQVAKESSDEEHIEIEAEVASANDIDAVQVEEQQVEDESDDDLIDDEILEIFVEEAEEVNETIQTYLPRYVDNYEDKEALTELRRAFHTLKGSGRMVEALDIGEIAWAVENLLNRIIDATTEMNSSIADFVQNIAAHIPALVENFKLRQAPVLNPVEVEAHAQALIAGEQVELSAPSTSELKESETPQEQVEQTVASEEIEDSLLSIFEQEATQHIDTIAHFAMSVEGDEAIAVNDALSRALHTLKGSANTAGIQPIAEIAVPLEHLVKELRANGLEVDAKLAALMQESMDVCRKGIAQLESSPQQNVPGSIELVAKLAAYKQQRMSDLEQETDALVPNTQDPQLVAMFLTEGLDILLDAERIIDQWQQGAITNEDFNKLYDEVTKLKRGAKVSGLNAIVELCRALESAYDVINHSESGPSSKFIATIKQGHDGLIDMMDQTAAGLSADVDANLLNLLAEIASEHQTLEQEQDIEISIDALEESLAEAIPDYAVEESEEELVVTEPEVVPEETIQVEEVDQTASGSLAELDPELAEIFLEEAQELINHSGELLHQWQSESDNFTLVGELQRDLHTLKGGARMAEVTAIGDLSHELETLFERTVEAQTVASPAVIELCLQCHDALASMVDSVEAGSVPAPALDLLEAVKRSIAGEEPVLSKVSAPQPEQTEVEPEVENIEATEPEIVEVEEITLVKETTIPVEPEPAEPVKPELSEEDALDKEVLDMFAEEAQELIEALETNMADWADAPTEQNYNQELQRVLHTLKGGARLASLDKLADTSHDFETRLIQAYSNGEAFEGELKALALKAQDALHSLTKDFLAQLNDQAPEEEPESVAPVEAVEQSSASQELIQLGQQQSPSKPVKEKKSGSQESVRVGASLIDALVNLAGETSISRGRLEQQITDFGFTLEEMAATIERLREQLRRMEMETEAQVLYRAEQEGIAISEYEEFDPLEMDRYSSIQQLSRSLSESATDLTELRDTLSNRARDAETLLLQQSRINSELQEGLMKTRMIPFSSMVPRLRRIVRQISGELDKAVDFKVANASGEMDRSVLDRMVAPLEHMLRNALDHGIESKEQRVKAGKPEAGTIALSVSREGGDIVIRMQDDGAGIDASKIRAKAVSQGLIAEDAKLSKQDILQLIMAAGFSTAEQVTQISGRGVGMDVVASEIKQLGGAISIDSTVGQGTQFTVRLPFTVSVNRALMVSTGDDFYAIPLNTIEGIVRVSPYELEEYYQEDAPPYRYAGRDYKLQYLGSLLHNAHQPKLKGQPLPLPVILVRGTDQPMALQVDSLMGSREIVVKSLGMQFSEVHGVSGATILGDGSVVVILDLPALIREESAGVMDVLDTDGNVDTQNETPLVMVVDDSVTVRKVSTRLLERNGMDVVTAKDGVDAIAQLQDTKPDVMLLDIEMPRMDGFEVATLVRHDERLKDVPIIMITSRTGQKHRDRAMSIGVNEYMGKPFQEQELLQKIEEVLAATRVTA